MDVAGKVAFITGGAGVIGLAMAQVFLDAGMRVALADRDPATLAEGVERLGDRPGLFAVAHDVADPASWEDTISRVEPALGPISLLCNNAGVASARKPIHEIDIAAWDRIMAVNLRGVFLGVRTLAPRMIAQSGGHIVNTASMSGMLGVTGLGDYTAMKFGVVGLSETLRAELAPHGVGVSILCPGSTGAGVGRTPAQNREAVAAGNMDPLWVARRVLAAVRANELYVFTHPEYRALVAARAEMLLAAFGEPAQPGFKTPKAQLERMSRSAYPPKA
jgi:NAD(P)-dependent dehydrogenase (short-subunit alcohol dehydrogenase family)